MELTGDEGRDEAAQNSAVDAPKKKRRKLIAAAAAAVLLLGGGGAGWWFLAPHGEEAASATPEPIEAEALVDVPAMTVNLRSLDGATKMLRVHMMLVPGPAGKEKVEGQLPLIIDAYQPFLRELRPEDIAGAAATYRVKEEMLIRANSVLGEGAVRDVLIQDLVQQG